jgi:hypothetical protein
MGLRSPEILWVDWWLIRSVDEDPSLTLASLVDPVFRFFVRVVDASQVRADFLSIPTDSVSSALKHAEAFVHPAVGCRSHSIGTRCGQAADLCKPTGGSQGG